jgi:predicted Rossmann fold nucleotide-binding protein DprA/Smf involved in DNA uptake
MKGHDLPNQRKLSMRSRYEETPNDLLVELKDGQYISLGDPAEVNKETRRKRLQDALSDTPELPKELAERAGLTTSQAITILRQLKKNGRVAVKGKGSKGNPYRYHRMIRNYPRKVRVKLHEGV